jgi:DNA-binding response OmpR family regulator/curved DNA-binding protein CbpA
MNNLSVLIVDDSPEFSSGLKRIFESFGWSAQVAENQEKAIFIFNEEPFDLVIVDCFIPGTDGFIISKELSDLNNETHGDSIFFLMSGILVDEASKKEALSYPHIRHFVKKPVDTGELKKALNTFFPEDKKSIIDFFVQSTSTLDHFNAEYENFASLDQVELPFLIKQLSELEFCGEIKVTSDGSETVLNFNNGEITSIFSQDFEDSIGELLVGLGFLTRENLSHYVSSDDFKNGTQRIGEALIEKNYVSPHAVPLALKEQKRIRLDKLLNKSKKNDFKISNRPHFEHDSSTSLASHEITRSLMDFFASLEPAAISTKILKSLKGLRASLNSVAEESFLKIELTDKESIAKKHNNGDRLTSQEIKSILSLLLCRGFEFTYSEEITSVSSNEKNQIKERVRYLSKKIKSENPYELLDLSPDNITDQRVSKKYQNLAKELHPDKLDKVLKAEELKEASLVFAEITKAFNSIKTAENRQTFESLMANQEAQDQIDCNNILEQAKKSLHSGKYTEAIGLLDSPRMHKNYPNGFGLYLLWASFKSKDHVLNQDSNKILDFEHKNLKNESIYYYLKALIANKNGDFKSFQKFIDLSLKADSHFLPARRELQIVRSQNNRKPEKSSWFSFKKSS